MLIHAYFRPFKTNYFGLILVLLNIISFWIFINAILRIKNLKNSKNVTKKSEKCLDLKKRFNALCMFFLVIFFRKLFLSMPRMPMSVENA